MPPKAIPPKISIQPYSGSPETVDFFFEQLLEIKELNNYSNKEIIAILKSKIQDKALTFYLDAIANQNFDSLSSIREEFVKFFGKKQDKCKASDQLDRCVMLSEESPRAFACRITKLCRLAYPTLNETALSPISFNYFLKNLPKNIKIKLLEENIDSLESAIDRTEQLLTIYSLDSGVESTQIEPVLHFKHTQVREPRLSPSKIFNEKRQKHQGVNNKNSHRQKSFNKRLVTCSFCAIPGHVMKDCFKFQSFIDNCRTNEQSKSSKLPRSPRNKRDSPKENRNNLNYQRRRR